MTNATPTQIFVVSVITNQMQNPLAQFIAQQNTLDFSDEKLWSLLSIKAIEQDSNYRPLAQHLISQGIIPVTELLIKAAALNFIHVMQVQNVMTKTSDEINKFMSDFRFDEKLVISNPVIDSMLAYGRTVFAYATKDQIIELRDYLEQQNLEQFCSLIPEIQSLAVPA